MADRRRAELAETVTDACEGLAECGFSGLLEVPVLKLFADLHKLNDTERISKLVMGLEEAATRMVAAKGPPSFTDLMVLSQLLSDVEGPAAPPEGEDSPLDTEFRTLSANLRLALCTALQQFARPGSEEARQGAAMAAGMLLMLHEKLAGDMLATLAVEHALLRLMFRGKAAVTLLRDRTWALTALNKQVAALKDYNPESEVAADENGDADDGEEDDGEEDEEEAEEAGEEEEAGGDEEGDGKDGAAGGEGEEEEEEDG